MIPLSAAALRDPYPWYAEMRRGAAVLHEPRADVWMIFDYEGVKKALHDHDAFGSRASPPGDRPPDWMVFSDPPRHAGLRALVTRAFTPAAVAALAPRIQALARELLDQALARPELDVCADFAVPLPLMVIAEMLGVPAGDWQRFKRWSDALIRRSHPFSDVAEAAEASAQLRAAEQEMSAYLADALARPRAGPRDDLLARLVAAEVTGERLGGDEIFGFFQLLLAAGGETTTNLLANAVLGFIESPAELARLLAAPELLPSAIEEVLRHRSPVQALSRVTRRDVAVNGRVIPAGELVLAVIGSANRDDAAFADAARFDIARDPKEHLAFGHGIHFCLGAALSRLEARVALAELFSRVRSFALASDAPWEPRPSFLVHGPTCLPVRVALRSRP